jgi:hypothetical protein
MVGVCIAVGEYRNACKILVWKPKEKRLHGRLMRNWEDNIKMDLREIFLGVWV